MEVIESKLVKSAYYYPANGSAKCVVLQPL